MGTRSHVHMVNSGVYLYQHFDGYSLPEEVQIALKKQWRWNDEEYLARIIFCTMIKEHGGEDAFVDETGYGIGNVQHSDIEWLVEVNVQNQEIIVREGYGELRLVWSGSFQEFIEADVTENALMGTTDEELD